MAVIYNAALKSARMNAVIAALDSGTAEAILEIGDGVPPAIGAVLVEIELEKPSFTEAGGVITMAGVPKSGDATQTGTASAAQIRANGTVGISGLTVGTSSAEVNLNSVAISSGQTVTCNSGNIAHG